MHAAQDESRVLFACRPLVLYPVAGSIYLFGWQEWSYVLPVLIASLINICIVYQNITWFCKTFFSMFVGYHYDITIIQ
jgi:hypothetical protein